MENVARNIIITHNNDQFDILDSGSVIFTCGDRVSFHLKSELRNPIEIVFVIDEVDDDGVIMGSGDGNVLTFTVKKPKSMNDFGTADFANVGKFDDRELYVKFRVNTVGTECKDFVLFYTWMIKK